jgi:hypothetical protein
VANAWGCDAINNTNTASGSGEIDTIDVDEIITALAKTVADALRRRILEGLTREISKFEAEYANAPASDVRR